MVAIAHPSPSSVTAFDPPPPPARKNVILVDLENVGNPELNRLAGMDVEVYLFLSAKAKHIRTELVVPAKNGGIVPRLIQPGGMGKNALDFHIAFYLGQLTLKHNGSCYHIVSKDGGFDPLVTHLRSRGIAIGRSPGIAELPFLPKPRSASPAPSPKAPSQSPPDVQKPKPTKPLDIANAYVQKLRLPTTPRPKTIERLFNALKHAFLREMTDTEFSSIFTMLQGDGHILLADGKLTYNVPCHPALKSS